MGKQWNFDVYSWEQVDLGQGENEITENELTDSQSPQAPGTRESVPPSNSMEDILKEFTEGKPQPVKEPAPEPEPAPGQPQGPGTAPGQPQGPGTAPGNVNYSHGQYVSAKMFMKGWDTLFAGAAVALCKRADKYDNFKAASQDLETLSEMLAEVMGFYNWNPSPALPFALGFSGVYGAKGFDIYQAMNSQPVNRESLQAELEITRLQAEIAALRSKPLAKKESALNVIKTGKRGRPRKI